MLVHLYIYNEMMKQKHSSNGPVFSVKVSSVKSVAINEKSFLFANTDKRTGAPLTLRDNWSSPVLTLYDTGTHKALQEV